MNTSATVDSRDINPVRRSIATLGRGRIVIVDLSRGSEIVLQTCSERVVRHILQRASERFRDGKPSRPMQIFIEEAHRLLHRDQVKGFETLICSGFSSGAYRDRTVTSGLQSHPIARLRLTPTDRIRMNEPNLAVWPNTA